MSESRAASMRQSSGGREYPRRPRASGGITTAFAVTWDYRCPFARNAHEHIPTGLAAGVEWDVRFLPLSLGQVHVEEGAPDVWAAPEQDPRAPSRRRGAGDNDTPADTCGAQVLRGLHYPHESEVRPTRRWGNLRGLTIGLPSVHKGTVLNDLGVSSRSPSADADLTGRSLIAASCAWVPGTQVGDRPTGRTNLLHRFVPGLPVSRGHGLLPRLLADKPAPRC
jgi:hypothetical protein